MKITFSADDARNIVYGEHEGTTVVRDVITGTSRWSTIHDLVFKYKEKLYQVRYHVGSTEYQDEVPFEYDKTVECTEVEPYEKLIVEYRPVK